MLQQFVARLGVGHVHFTGHVSNAELTAYYDVADLFLCASEHEGFCVPIVEAFYKGIPVVAYASTAVPSTMDGAGVLYTTRDPLEVAALVDARRRRRGVVRSACCTGQDEALERLRAKDFDGTLLRYVETCWLHRRNRRRASPGTSGTR